MPIVKVLLVGFVSWLGLSLPSLKRAEAYDSQRILEGPG